MIPIDTTAPKKAPATLAITASVVVMENTLKRVAPSA